MKKPTPKEVGFRIFGAGAPGADLGS